MDRRDVLKLGAAASLGGSGCASLLSNPAAVGAGEMDGFLASLDGALDSIGSRTSFDRFLPSARNAQLAARAKRGEELTRKTLRSLLLVGTLQELPPEQLAHEGVQQRLRTSMGEFDDAMFGMTSMLEGLSSTERADISRALREDPQLGMRVMGAVDEEAATFGVSMKVRTKLRGLSTHTCARLRQSPELMVTEYTGKMHKLAARHGAQAEAERAAAAAIGTALLWQGQPGEGGAVGGGPLDGGLSAPPPPPQLDAQFDAQEVRGADAPGDVLRPTPPPATAPAKRKGPRASHVVLTVGGIALGLGATLLGIGFVSGNSGILLVGATFGALLGIAGLITLIVGLILLAVGK